MSSANSLLLRRLPNDGAWTILRLLVDHLFKGEADGCNGGSGRLGKGEAESEGERVVGGGALRLKRRRFAAGDLEKREGDVGFDVGFENLRSSRAPCTGTGTSCVLCATCVAVGAALTRAAANAAAASATSGLALGATARSGASNARGATSPTVGAQCRTADKGVTATWGPCGCQIGCEQCVAGKEATKCWAQCGGGGCDAGGQTGCERHGCCEACHSCWEKAWESGCESSALPEGAKFDESGVWVESDAQGSPPCPLFLGCDAKVSLAGSVVSGCDPDVGS